MAAFYYAIANICCMFIKMLILCAQIELLEWTDDLEMFILKGYGKSLNYRMGLPLLEDVVQSMEQAIVVEEGSLVLHFLSVYYIHLSYMPYHVNETCNIYVQISLLR